MNIQLLVDKLNLGQILATPEKLLGGALHTMIKLETTKGTYAIKQLNPHITAKTHFKKAYELSEHIASKLTQSAIPAVNALSFEEQTVVQIDKDYCMVYPFVNGHLLDEASLNLDHAACVGALYSSIHAAAISLSDVDKAHYDYFENAHWDQLIRQSNNPELIELLPVILHWNQEYVSVIPELNKESVITHRDMHLQNILWDSGGQPHIIDWESAGFMNPMLEVIGYGLEWSGIILHQKVNIPFFRKLIETYCQNTSKEWITTPHQAFWGWLGHCVLAWTEFNIRRMIGDISTELAEITKGHEIIEQKMVPCLTFIMENERTLRTMIKSAFSTN